MPGTGCFELSLEKTGESGEVKMDLKKVLAEKEVIIFDGGTGTELARRGVEASGTTNLTNPAAILEFHSDYVELGVDALTTNTFNMNRISIESKGLDADLREANLAGVSLARKAAAESRYVFGNIGPTGKLLEPYGTYSEEQFSDNFEEQARILLEGGVNGFIIETMTDLREAVCALKATRTVTALPIIVTLSFADTEKGGHTIMGSTVAEIAEALEKHGADALGANCGDLAPAEMAQIAAIYKENTALPILIQPNAGKPKLIDDKTVYDMSPEEFANGVLQCIDSGASLVGGCCGTTLEHLRAVIRQIR